MKLRKAKEIKEYFLQFKMPEDSRSYIIEHHRRYERLLNKIDTVCELFQHGKESSPIHILDIGPAFQTEILRATMPEDIIVDTLGFPHHITKPRSKEKHINYDLNDSQWTKKWINIGPYDLIIFAEVFEHLYVSSTHFMPLITSWLKKNGYMILEVPNGMQIWKRIRMLLGIHPFVPLREVTGNSHFREPSVKDMRQLLKDNGYEIIDFTCKNDYFNVSPIKNLLNRTAEKILPKSFSGDMIFVLRKEKEDGVILSEDQTNNMGSQSQTKLRADIGVKFIRRKIRCNEALTGHVEIMNTGKSKWLTGTEDFGQVNLGAHLLNEERTMLDFDYFRYNLRTDNEFGVINPGDSIDFDIRVPNPGKGKYILELDMVSEEICWFHDVGSRKIEIEIEVVDN